MGSFGLCSLSYLSQSKMTRVILGDLLWSCVCVPEQVNSAGEEWWVFNEKS